MAKELAENRTVTEPGDIARAVQALHGGFDPLEYQAVAYAAVRKARKRQREAEAKSNGRGSR